MNNKKLTANEIIELFDLNGIGIYEFVEGEYEPEDIVDEDGEVVAIGEVVEVSREEEVTDGWGYDIMYPTNWKWHTKKNYVDNFAWKGHPTPEENYD